MPNNLTNYRVFIASPRGLDDERTCFKSCIQNFNESDANHRGVHFTPVGWDITLGGVGRPQGLINEEIKTCDYFILLLHDRWGSYPGSSTETRFSSGTEEEFHVAFSLFNDTKMPMRELVLFFKAVSDRQLSDAGEQLQKVLAFRKEREKLNDFLYHTFDTIENFAELFRRHLAKWVREHETNTKINQNTGLVIDKDKIKFKDVHLSAYTSTMNDELLISAEELASSGDLVEAEVAFSKLVVKGGNPWALARYGRFLRKIGQASRAKVVLDEALDLSAEMKDIHTKAYATRQLARLQEDQGDFVSSTALLRKANALYETFSDFNGMARSLRDLGQILRKRGLLEDAIHELEEARKIYINMDNKEGQASTLGYLGLVYRSLGKLKHAELAHNESLHLQQELGNEEAQAIALGNIGVILRQQGKHEEAKQKHIDAFEIHEKLGKMQGVARELSNLGTVFRHLGELATSREYHERSLALSEQMGNKHGIAIQLSCIGQIDTLEGNYESAEKHHLKALSINKSTNEAQSIAIQYKNLATIYRLNKEVSKAKDMAYNSLNINEKYHFKSGIAQCKIELAKISLQAEEAEQANIHLVEALALSYEIGAEHDCNTIKSIIEAIKNQNTEVVGNFVQNPTLN
ncbi:tetratricopeptide repeat protein [Geomonas sp. Red32]|uniref:tetratricopeptide repeat protein n=1 Tax=Geomonas sp. Red32 TaxID=2912856 RepID=UPI00202CD105|nr:tetratricopeptide repeat protein [Geomonas sp. Red32]MCM0082362.1 tetratricopeptide repeat protein [Geomonas sp. Red32]